MNVYIEQRANDSFIAHCSCAAGTIIGTGSTESECVDDFYNSIEEVKRTYSDGEPMPSCLNETLKFLYID